MRGKREKNKKGGEKEEESNTWKEERERMKI